MSLIESMPRWCAAALMSLPVVVLPTMPAWADFVINGSFENGSSNWSSTPTGMEINSHSVFGLGPNGAGNQNVELDGTTFDTISQTLTGLTSGQSYLLSWQYAGRSGSGNQEMDVLFNGVRVGLNLNNGVGQMSWSLNSAVVTATGTSALLQFAAINVGGSSDVGNELDDVEFNVYVPEPNSMGLMISGLGVLALASLVRWRPFRRG